MRHRLSFLALLAPAVLPAQGRDSVSRRDSIFRLPEITVTATRSQRVRPEESPVSASVDSVPAAERAAARVAADLLRGVVGTHVQQTSAGQGAVVLRGLVGNQVLLLVDGIPMNNGTYRDGPGQYLATIDPETIERLEVVRGPASVLYGSDAQGGVVNVITRPHQAGLGWSIGAAGQGSTANDGARGRVSAGYGGESFRVAGGVSFAHAGDLRPGGDLSAQRPTGFRTLGLDARLDVVPHVRHRITAAVQHFGMHDVRRYDRYVTFRAPAPGPDARHEFDPQTRQLAYARWTVRPERPALVRLELSASLAVQREGRLRQRLVDGEPDTETEYTRDDVYTPGFGLLGESWLSLGGRGVALTYGVEVFHDRLASRGEVTDLTTNAVTPLQRLTTTGAVPAGRFPDGATMDRGGVFLEADAVLAPRLHLSAGGRWSGFRTRAEVGAEFGGGIEQSYDHLTGQVGMVLGLVRGLSLTARVAEGFRAPNLYDLTNVGPVPGGIALPNPDAEPERSMSYEAGLRATLPRAAFEVTGWRAVIDGFIDRAPGSFRGDTLFAGERVFQGLNVGEARMWGLEAEALHRAGPVSTRATLQYTYGEQTPADSVVEPMAKIPPLSGTVRLRLQPGDRWWVGYELTWATEQNRLARRDLADPRIQPGGTPGYAVHALLAGATVSPGVSVSAGLENLSDTLYRTHASGVDAPGRHFWVGVSVSQGL